MSKIPKGKMLEKVGDRGLVPDRASGAHDRAYNGYLNTIDPRNNRAVQIALAGAADPRFREFFERLEVARYERFSLATIAKGCGIDLAEFNNFISKASSQIAVAHAQLSSVKITEHMAEDALTKDAPCGRCDALGWVAAAAGLPDPTPDGYRCIDPNPKSPIWIRTCPLCRGGLYVPKIGDNHSRDRILEVAGVIKKDRGGASINLNFGTGAHASAVNDLDDAMTIDVNEVEGV